MKTLQIFVVAHRYTYLGRMYCLQLIYKIHLNLFRHSTRASIRDNVYVSLYVYISM
jgi:hypothetical protein